MSPGHVTAEASKSHSAKNNASQHAHGPPDPYIIGKFIKNCARQYPGSHVPLKEASARSMRRCCTTKAQKLHIAASSRRLQARGGAKSSSYLKHWDDGRSARCVGEGKGVHAGIRSFMHTCLLDLADDRDKQSPCPPCREEFWVIFRTLRQALIPSTRREQPLPTRRSRHVCK